MPFEFNVGFTTEQDKNAFVEKIVPRVRAHETDPKAAEGAEEDGLHSVGLSVTSPSAARDVCYQVVAFLAHTKNNRVTLSWTGIDGQAQSGQVNAESARDAEIVAMRLGAAAKVHLDAEKSAD